MAKRLDDAARAAARAKLGGSGSAGANAPPRDGIVRIARETQGRGGKGVTVIHGLPLVPSDLETLAGELKRRCGAGGKVNGAVIEIQGEHRDTLVAELTRRGYTVKRAGG